MKVALIGFMGTGKSSTGKLLAEKLGFDFFDTDLYLEEKMGIAIPEIFAAEGEGYFRKLEKSILKEILDKKGNLVLATGGGIVLSAENRKLLKFKTFPVLLTASPEEIYRRTRGGGRPLLDKPNSEKRIRELLKVRNQYYNKFHYSVDTGNKDVSKVVEEILIMVKRKYK